MSASIDKLDRKILDQLQVDAALPAAEIGEIVGLSQAAVWRRIQKLEQSGVIKKRVAILDAEKIDCGTLILAHVKLSAHGRANLESFAKKIREIPSVLECFVVLGDQDFFLKIAVKDIYDYETLFFQKISSIEGVAEVRSAVALSQIKNETALPVRSS